MTTPNTLHLNREGHAMESSSFSETRIRKIRNDIILTKHVQAAQRSIVHS